MTEVVVSPIEDLPPGGVRLVACVAPPEDSAPA
jgi:hypothetical protein